MKRISFPGTALRTAFPRVAAAIAVSAGMLASSIEVSAQSPAPSAATGKPAAAKDDSISYAIPEGSPAEIIKFVNDLQEARPKVQTREEMVQHAIKVQHVLIEAGGKILANKSATEDEAKTGAEMLLNAHTLLANARIPGEMEKAVAAATKLKGDSRKDIADLAASRLVLLKIFSASTMTPTDRGKLEDEVIAAVSATNYSRESIGNAMQLSSALEELEDPAECVGFLKKLSEAIKKSDTPEIQQLAKQVEGTARRLGLMGHPMEVKGTTVDGKPFDLANWQGKVVLVDFWATWCGPCIAEMPHVKEAYEAYHEKGFEVVGISLDDDKAELEKFVKEKQLPWPTLYPSADAKDDEKGWGNPLATYYGISGIPTCILIGKDGNVVSLMARGEELDTQLKKLLGPAPQAEKAKSE